MEKKTKEVERNHPVTITLLNGQIVDLDKLKESMLAAVNEGIEIWKKSLYDVDIHHHGDGFYNLIKEAKNE